MRIHGILNLNKPPQLTSRQAVDRVKRLLNVSKAGHGGTLDPDATGVLLICLGDATKLFEALQVGTKGYEGTLILGTTTDTLDASGRILEMTDTSQITPGQIQSVSQQFVGEIEQIAPMFSAVKHKGKRLYKLARRGIEVQRPPRKVLIESLEILSINIPEVRFRVVCSKGTYIRVLAADMGAVLGCGGHLSQLTRTRSGVFHIVDSHTLDCLERIPSLADQAVTPIDVVIDLLN
ncbi:MAG: tRNA pseudouridine(55) synthase TruB [Candidatus Poribacteria bacterium]|nr:tRNA pseudouridine(55) synthase TruB [Candidatus Poribacteria bacterium]